MNRQLLLPLLLLVSMSFGLRANTTFPPVTFPLELETAELAHKFYVSVTNIEYSEKSQSFQIISRIFIDDLDLLLKERYGIEAKLNTEEEAKIANEYIARYFDAKLLLSVNGEQRKATFLGKRYEDDLILCFLELEYPQEDLQDITVQNDVLTDLFDEQKNLVHLKILGQKKSFVLIRENNKGMLNLK